MPRASIVSRIAHESCLRAPSLLHGGRWWRDLPEDFPQRQEAFELQLRDRVRVRATAAGDIALRSFAAVMLGSLAGPLGYHPFRLRDALRDRELYGPMAESGDPTRFFDAPPRGVSVSSRRARLTSFRPLDAVVEDLRFDSPFVPKSPSERDRYLRHVPNRRAHARHWRHKGGPRPTIIAIHGFSADFYLANEYFFALPWLFAQGCNVALFTLPFHGRRQPKGSPFSGHGFLAGGISRINEAMAQSVLDLRILIEHFFGRGAPHVGVTGVSLGGHVSAVLAAVEPRLGCAIPNVAVVSIPDLALEWEPIATIAKAAMRAYGLGIQDVRHLLAVSCPLTYRPVIDRERLFVVGGVGDRLAPPKHSRLLWDHWERCRIHWFPGSHLLHLDRGEYLFQIGKFLRNIGFLAG